MPGAFPPRQSQSQLESDVSASSAEALSTTDQPAEATSPPVPGESQSTPGPLPYDRHKAILDKAYAERDALKTQMQQLSWAQDIPSDQAAKVAEFVQRANGNPVEFFLEYGRSLMDNPETAAAIRSNAARILGTRAQAAPAQPQQAPQPQASEFPQPSMVIDGMALYTPEAMQQVARAIQQQVLDAVTPVVGEQIGPVASLAQRLREAEETQAQAKVDHETASAFLSKAAKWPGFAENKTKLAAAVAEGVQSGRWTQAQGDIALYEAYIELVAPTLGQTSAANLLRDLKTQAITGPSPGSAQHAGTPASGPRPTWQTVFAS
jgi:hypothetical protein